jgi:hypothetical protein
MFELAIRSGIVITLPFKCMTVYSLKEGLFLGITFFMPSPGLVYPSHKSLTHAAHTHRELQHVDGGTYPVRSLDHFLLM